MTELTTVSELSLCNDCPVTNCFTKNQFYEVRSCGKRTLFEAKGE